MCSYYQTILRRGTLPSVTFDLDADTCAKVEIKDVRDVSGDKPTWRLPESIAEALYKEKQEQIAKRNKEHQEACRRAKQAGEPAPEPEIIDPWVPVTVGLVGAYLPSTDPLQGDSHVAGLLLVQGKMDATGVLVGDKRCAPWIPADRMYISADQGLDIMVGCLERYPHAIPLIEQAQSADAAAAAALAGDDDPDFEFLVQCAENLLAQTQDDSFRRLRAAEERSSSSQWAHSRLLPRTSMVVRVGEKFDPSSELRNLLEAASSYQEPLPALEYLFDPVAVPLRSTATIACPRPTPERGYSEQAVANSKALCGTMNADFGLTPSQRRAVYGHFIDRGWGQGQEGGSTARCPLTAISGPPGTGKTTLLQAVIASTIVHHALEGLPAPLIVGASTNNQAVTNIVDSMALETDKDSVLGSRWLPVARERKTQRAQQQDDKTHTATGSDADDAAHTEQMQAPALYSLATYFPSAQRQAAAKKRGYLIGKARKEGVYADYSAPEYVAAASRRYLRQARALFGTDLPAAAQVGEDTPATAAALTAVVEHCRQVLRTLDAARRDLLDAQLQQDETQRSVLRKVTTLFQASAKKEHIDRLAATGVLSDAAIASLSAAQNLQELDSAVDTSVRYAEFWLAMHYYEGQWLVAAVREEIIAEQFRGNDTVAQMEKYWSQLACLTPCLVMTAYQLPRHFKVYDTSGEQPVKRPDFGRIDLLIIDEAGQVDVPVGAPGLALARQVLLVGDCQQLPPVWNVSRGTDAETFTSCQPSSWPMSSWEAVEQRALAASAGSSLMQASSLACRWVDDDLQPRFAGLLLQEHFRCDPDIIAVCNELLYEGQLLPQRSRESNRLRPAYGAPLQFAVVANSHDRPAGTSRVNFAEAQAIVAWLLTHAPHVRRAYAAPGQAAARLADVVAVVTPFKAQADLIRRLLSAIDAHNAQHSGTDGAAADAEQDEDNAQRWSAVTVGTAHALQGAERPVVLMSLVYGNDCDAAPFVENNPELMNVAVSRAKDLLVIFGAAARTQDSGRVMRLLLQHCADAAPIPALDPELLEAMTSAQGDGAGEDKETVAHVPPAPAAGAAHEHTQAQPHHRQEHPTGVPGAHDTSDAADHAPAGEEQQPEAISLSAVLDALRAGDLGPQLEGVSARKMNKVLSGRKLLRQVSEQVDGQEKKWWVPTAEGRSQGIVLREGENVSGKFKYPCYTDKAQRYIAQLLREGKLDH